MFQVDSSLRGKGPKGQKMTRIHHEIHSRIHSQIHLGKDSQISSAEGAVTSKMPDVAPNSRGTLDVSSTVRMVTPLSMAYCGDMHLADVRVGAIPFARKRDRVARLEITTQERLIFQKTVPGRVRVKFAQNGGHEKATKKPRKSNEKGPNTVFLDRRGPRKSHEKTTKKPRKSNE